MLSAIFSSKIFINLLWKSLKYVWKQNKTELIQNIKGVNKAVLVKHRVADNKTAVVFIHGYSGDATKTWGKFPVLIQAENSLKNWDVLSIGYHTNLMPDFKGLLAAKPDVQKLADQLRTRIKNQLKPQYNRIIVVAHSMGGLVTQRALLDMPSEEVNTLIHSVLLFGTPSQGLKKANLFTFFNQQIKDMGTNSPFITTLRTDWTEKFGTTPPFLFITIAGDTDEFVTANSSLLAFGEQSREVTNGNHSDMVKPNDRNHLSFDIVRQVMETNQYYNGRWDGAEVALELGDFAAAKTKFAANKDKLDANGQVKYAFALEALGNTQEAINYLSAQNKTPHTDVMGTLAGRWKRLWLQSSVTAEAEQALQLYQDAYDLANAQPNNEEQIFYLAINLAFFQLVYCKDLRQAQEYATIAIKNCKDSPKKEDLWRYATLGEANLYLQNKDAAFDNYLKALKLKPTPRNKESMFLQWEAVVTELGMLDLKKELEVLFYSYSIGE